MRVFIASNLDTENNSIKQDIRAGFAIIAIDNLLSEPLRMIVAKKLNEQLKEEEKKASGNQPMAAFSTVAKS